LSKVKELHPDIVIADANMSGQDGYDLCRAIKTDPSLSNVRVLLLSGSQQTYDESKGKDAGVDGYMIKPFETQALVKKVQELVENASAGISQITQALPKQDIPSPASTISISAPYSPQANQGLSNEPFLDMDFSHASLSPAESELDLAPDTMSGFPLLSDTTQPIPKEMKNMVSSATSKEMPAQEDDFWNFSSTNSNAEMGVTATPENQTQNWNAIEPSPMVEEASASFDLSLMGTAESANMPPSNAGPEIELSNVDFGYEAPPVADLSMDFSSPAPKEEEPSFSIPIHEEVSFSTPHLPTTTASVGAPISLSNEQIEAIVSRVFKEVIERIAWEVVPDMAENIIKEELARLLKK